MHHIGHAAIKFRNNSTDNILQNSMVSYTGLSAPENGEAVYIGSSISHWQNDLNTGLLRPDCSSRNQILNNYFGPYVSAESVDIKEGTDGTLVEHNTINGIGMSDKNYSNTWVSLKGSDSIIRRNNGSHSVLDGFSVKFIEFLKIIW